MLGLSEVLLMFGGLAAIAIFGRKTIKKLMRDGFGIKKDFEEIKKENELENTKV